MDEANATQFYIATTSAPAEDRTRVLKYGRMFAVFDRFGDIKQGGLGEEGIFFEGTRFLSELGLYLGNRRPMLLSSTIREDNCLFTADLTNVDLSIDDHITIPRGTLHLTRSKVLWGDACYEQLHISNYGLEPVKFQLLIAFNSDFADLFEVRGTHRKHKGQRLEGSSHGDVALLSYRGLDDLIRHTRIRCHPAPQTISSSHCQYQISLQPKQQMTVELAISCLYQSSKNGHHTAFHTALSEAATRMQRAGNLRSCTVHSSNQQFNDWMQRSVADIQMMVVGNPEVDYPYAGVPWFSTVFGRDGIITALECLWANPSIARGVLHYLADTQAREENPRSDAEPGKIIHESRAGEMAALGEVPFARYYGTADATPLFIILAGSYFARTANHKFIAWLWPHIEAALHWIDRYGDRDGDGFVEFARHTSQGLAQQGWRDSGDSVFHADGTLAEAPIALCEVQGYVYGAKRAAAQLAQCLGKPEFAAELDRQAHVLRERFEENFWCPDLGTYAVALDRYKKPCRVRTSTPGHCLAMGILRPERAAIVAHTLMSPDFYNGWGIRTVGTQEVRYNPVSYHNGSMWPHDNAIIALGFARYGFNEYAARILEGFLDLSVAVDLHRLPELLCGLARRGGEGPTLYPVACAPQAWAAGAVYMLLEACLGISIDAHSNRLMIEKPCLPPPIERIWIRQLQLNHACIDLLFEQTGGRIEVKVIDKQGEIDLRII